MSGIIDHVGLAVRDLAASTRFYEQALAPLGLTVLYRHADFVAFGRAGNDDLGLHQAGTHTGGAHIAFAAENDQMVDHFWQEALAAGGTPVWAPAICSEYHEGYYAAFVYDREGNNIEAVCHHAATDTRAGGTG